MAKAKAKEPVQAVKPTVEKQVRPLSEKVEKGDKGEISVEEKLKALFSLQQVDSEIDRIRTVRGELPLEVQDLEDEVAGLETRIQNYTVEVNALEDSIVEKKNKIKDSTAEIRRFTEQQDNVRNNREFDALTKEIEFQNLEIQLSEKKMREYKYNIDEKNVVIEQAQKVLEERKSDLEHKKGELQDIIDETRRDEELLNTKSLEAEKIIEDRLLTAYKRIRKNARNGLAVVSVQRDACGGCFNKIPPQRQLDIRQRKKIIVCEHCGRILVAPEIEMVNAVAIDN